MNVEDMIFVSVDDHVVEPPDMFEGRLPAKYVDKAKNGYHHSTGFTLQPSRPDAPGAKLAFHEPIQIKEKNSQILQDNCLRCHGDFVHEIVRGSTFQDDAIRCVHCHRGAGHGAR